MPRDNKGLTAAGPHATLQFYIGPIIRSAGKSNSFWSSSSTGARQGDRKGDKRKGSQCAEYSAQDRAAQRLILRAENLVGAWIHAGHAVMPAEAFLVKGSPKKAQTQWQCGDPPGGDAAQEHGARWVAVVHGAEGDASIVHARRCVAERKKHALIEQPQRSINEDADHDRQLAAGQLGRCERKDK